MKKLHSIGILLIILLASYSTKAQFQPLAELSITPPSLEYANYDNLNDVLQHKLEYPVQSLNKRIQGTEIVRFSVNSFGDVEDIKIVKSVSREIDDEMIRVLRSTNGKWTPGTIDGKSKSMERELALVFVLFSYKDIQCCARSFVLKGNELLFSKNKPEKALRFYNMAYNLLPFDSQVQISREYCIQELDSSSLAMKSTQQTELPAGQKWIVKMPDDEEYVTFQEPVTIFQASR